MSSELAIATVTAILKSMLDEAFNTSTSAVKAVTGEMSTSAVSPVQYKDALQKPTINLFLYQVMLNQGWRNAGLPSADDRGARLSNPPMALDLYYLLTAYGKQDYDAEAMLGSAMMVFHETPVLSRDMIRQYEEKDEATVGARLKSIYGSRLSEQVELIKIAPHQLSVEEISKLWSSFMVSYYPSMAYRVSVVLIEAEKPARSPVPVLIPVVDVRANAVAPRAIPATPTLAALTPVRGQPAARLGENLTLGGYHLDGEKVFARFKLQGATGSPELPSLPGNTPETFQVKLPAATPDDWQAGVYQVSAAIRNTGQPDVETNSLPMVLAPHLVSAAYDTGTKNVTIACTPKLKKGQHVTAIIGDREIDLGEMGSTTGSVVFPPPAGLKGLLQVRLRVDGIESILVDRSTSPPEFDTYDQHAVNIP